MFAVLLVLAAALRMGWPGVSEFKLDEAHLYSLALDVAEFRSLPLRGLGSSVGIANPPVSVYLFALPLLVWKSPQAATLFVGALNTVSVALAYVLVRRYFSVRAAILATLLYAVSPWAVIYSRKVWAQDLLPLPVLAWAFSALLAFVERRPRWLIAHLALLATAAQIHFSGVALAPATAILLLVFRRRVERRSLALGLAAGAVTLVPFGIYLANQSGGSAGTLLSHAPVVDAAAVTLAALVVQGTGLHALAGPEAYRAFDASVPPFAGLLYLGGVVSALALAWALAKTVVRRTRTSPAMDAGLVLAMWMCVPVLFFTAHTTPVSPHYFILLFPAPYLLAGVFLDDLLTSIAHQAGIWRRRFAAAAVVAAPFLVAASQVWLVVALLRFVDTRATPGAFGTPLHYLLQVSRQARALGQGAGEIIVLSAGSQPESDEAAAVFDVLLRGVSHRLVDGRLAAVFPAGRAVVLVWPGDWPGADLYREWSGGDWQGAVPLRAGEGQVMLGMGNAEPAVPQPREASALLANGVEVLGSGGAAGRWELWWRAPGPIMEEDYQVFAHLLDAWGQRLSQFDARFFSARDWQQGDLVVSFFPLEVDSGAAVRAGMYAYPSLAAVPVLDAQGQPAGDSLVFPLKESP